MQSIKQFQNDQSRLYASVVSEPRQGLLMDVWNGQAQSTENMKQVLDYSLNSIKEHNLSSWLSEVSKLDALFEVDPEGAEVYLRQHLAQTPLCKIAFVYKAAGVKHIEKITRIFIRCGVEVKGCATSVMAMQWLLKPRLVNKPEPVLEL